MGLEYSSAHAKLVAERHNPELSQDRNWGALVAMLRLKEILWLSIIQVIQHCDPVWPQHHLLYFPASWRSSIKTHELRLSSLYTTQQWYLNLSAIRCSGIK